MDTVWHRGEFEVQRRAGSADIASRVAAGIHTEIPEVAAEFLAAQAMLIAAAADTDGRVWASMLTGPLGFARATGPYEIRVDAVPARGDPLANALERGPTALGMLAIEPESRRRLRFNGLAALRGGALHLFVEQVFSNCPKYISVRRREPVPVGTGDPVAVERATRIGDAQRYMIERADTFFIATAHETAGADASHRGGRPGFVRVDDSGALTWPDYRGNGMFMTLGNLEADPRAGLLFPDWETGDLLMLSGLAQTDWDEARAAAVPGAQRLVRFQTDAVVCLREANRWRWTFEEHSRVSPPALARA